MTKDHIKLKTFQLSKYTKVIEPDRLSPLPSLQEWPRFVIFKKPICRDMVVTEGEEFFPWEVLLRRHQLSLAIIPTIKQWELYYLGMSQSISSFYHFPELRPS